MRGSADDRPMNTSLPLYSNRSLLVRLNSEWQLLRDRPSVLRRAKAWCLEVPFDDLDQVIAATDYWATPAARAAAVSKNEAHPAAGSRGNEVVARLLGAARSDEVAARVVLQRLLPGLISRSRCWGPHRVGGSTEAFDELVSAAWTIIRQFPFERRPRHLVANLLRDSEYDAFQRCTRRMLVHEFTEPRSLDTAVEYQAEIEPLLELADLIAEGRAHSLTDHDVELLTLLANGASPAEAAEHLHVSERTLRYHRAAAVERLREAVLAAA